MKISAAITGIMSVLCLCIFQRDVNAMGQYPGYPRVEIEKNTDLSGNFSVIFYGGTYSNDVKTVVILDLEGDEYAFSPFTSEYNYDIKKGVPADVALKNAEWFVRGHTDYYATQMQRITDHMGKVIGYEVRPLFHAYRFGFHDVLDVHYWFKDNKVLVTVETKRGLRKRFYRRDLDDY